MKQEIDMMREFSRADTSITCSVWAPACKLNLLKINIVIKKKKKKLACQC